MALLFEKEYKKHLAAKEPSSLITRPQGRPAKFDGTVRIAASVPQEIAEAMAKYCAEVHIQKAEFFRRAAAQFLKVDYKWDMDLDPVRATLETNEGSAF